MEQTNKIPQGGEAARGALKGTAVESKQSVGDKKLQTGEFFLHSSPLKRFGKRTEHAVSLPRIFLLSALDRVALCL